MHDGLMQLRPNQSPQPPHAHTLTHEPERSCVRNGVHVHRPVTRSVSAVLNSLLRCPPQVR